jgi:hypothetical protein
MLGPFGERIAVRVRRGATAGPVTQSTSMRTSFRRTKRGIVPSTPLLRHTIS